MLELRFIFVLSSRRGDSGPRGSKDIDRGAEIGSDVEFDCDDVELGGIEKVGNDGDECEERGVVVDGKVWGTED